MDKQKWMVKASMEEEKMTKGASLEMVCETVTCSVYSVSSF